MFQFSALTTTIGMMITGIGLTYLVPLIYSASIIFIIIGLISK